MIVDTIPSVYKTGFSSIDSKFSGIRTKEVMVIGSLPAVGKTSFALSIAKGLINHNTMHFPPIVCYFSLDASKEEILKRYVNIPKHLQIDDNAHSIEDICNRITDLSRGFGIKVFLIDYYSKISSSSNENKEERISKLKVIAEDLDVAIICLEEIYVSKPNKWSFEYRIDENLCNQTDVVLILEQDKNSKIQAFWAKDKMNRENFSLCLLHDESCIELNRCINEDTQLPEATKI